MMPYRNKTTPYIGIFFCVPLAWSSRQPYMTGQLEIQIQNLCFAASRGRCERRPIVLRTPTISLYLITVSMKTENDGPQIGLDVLNDSTFLNTHAWQIMNRAPE